MFIFNADKFGFNNDPSRIKAIKMKESVVYLGALEEHRPISSDRKTLAPFIVLKGTGVQTRWISINAYTLCGPML